MKKLVLTLITLTSVAAQADVFVQYEEKARSIIEMSNQPQTTDDQLAGEINQLISLGYVIMELVAEKSPECLAQFDQIKQEDAAIRNMTYDEIDRLYHKGQGLPAAPRVCYIGRSMVVHPYQVLTLVPGGISADEREDFDHEIEEVAERAEKIKRSLGI